MQQLKTVCVVLVALTGCEDEADDIDVFEDTFPFRMTIENVAPFQVLKSGTIGTAPIGFLETMEIRFTAGREQYVSFATMMSESNDWFFAPIASGIPLFDPLGSPISGDVTSYVKLWDAGTELDQVPGFGDAVGTRQPMPGVGAADPDKNIREVSGIDATSLIQVTLVHHGGNDFSLLITNQSMNDLVTSQGAISIHLSPLTWALHRTPAPLFTPGTPDRALGLERIAEDGMPANLTANLATVTGIATPLSPGVLVLNHALTDISRTRIAEDGDIGAALTEEYVLGFDTPVGASAPSLAMPGQRYELTFRAAANDHMWLYTMFGASNDWFFAINDFELFVDEDEDEPRSGLLPVVLFDNGSEVDQELDVGFDTGSQQLRAEQGAADPNPVVRVAQYPVSVDTHIRVTLTPAEE